MSKIYRFPNDAIVPSNSPRHLPLQIWMTSCNSYGYSFLIGVGVDLKRLPLEWS